eukprot:TRINITY_DN3227_c0_g1_i1.p1 TRINITY_DN3227_c0_g1~~TRINITY_DN3227_c0_g1_i1.p1  ORF type:complete len:363 (+),score=83.73 TRINITY_DN3227_c0_g1_i1:58-1146(+)
MGCTESKPTQPAQARALPSAPAPEKPVEELSETVHDEVANEAGAEEAQLARSGKQSARSLREAAAQGDASYDSSSSVYTSSEEDEEDSSDVEAADPLLGTYVNYTSYIPVPKDRSVRVRGVTCSRWRKAITHATVVAAFKSAGEEAQLARSGKSAHDEDAGDVAELSATFVNRTEHLPVPTDRTERMNNVQSSRWRKAITHATVVAAFKSAGEPKGEDKPLEEHKPMTMVPVTTVVPVAMVQTQSAPKSKESLFASPNAAIKTLRMQKKTKPRTQPIGPALPNTNRRQSATPSPASMPWRRGSTTPRRAAPAATTPRRSAAPTTPRRSAASTTPRRTAASRTVSPAGSPHTRTVSPATPARR